MSDFEEKFKYMARGRRIILASYLVVMNLLFFFFVLAVWPGIEWIQLAGEIRLLLIATLAAGCGSTFLAQLSFYNLSYKHRLFESWNSWYLIYPFTGLPTGLCVYAVIRFGILKTGSSLDALNPYFIALLSALAGYWAVRIFRRLKEAAERRKWRYMKR